MFDDVEFDTFVGEELQRPSTSSFGRSGASDFDQLGFGSTIEEIRDGRSETLFSFESGFESFFDESFADVGNGVGVAMKLFSDFVIGNFAVSRLF